MSKEKIKQEIKSLNKKEINEIKEFVEHLSTDDSKGGSNENSFEYKKIVQIEHSHEKAAEFLEKVENIINKQENAEEILMRLYTEVHDFKKSIYDAPDFFEGLSWAIHKCISSNKKESDNMYSKFKIVQFLEDIYNGEYFTEDYTKEMHEQYFQEGANLAYTTSNEEVKEVLGDLYSDYLQI